MPDLQAQITSLRRDLKACQTEALGQLAGRIEDACSQLESEALRISGLTDASCQVGINPLICSPSPALCGIFQSRSRCLCLHGLAVLSFLSRTRMPAQLAS